MLYLWLYDLITSGGRVPREMELLCSKLAANTSDHAYSRAYEIIVNELYN